MVTCKSIKLLGTSGLVKSNRLLVYNTNTFKNSRICDILGLSDYERDILQDDPDISTINEIYDALKRREEFVFMEDVGDIDKEKHFLFNNDNLNSISGEGFNIMVFLEDDDILGYIVLLSPLGNSTTTKKTRYILNKTFLVKTIDIYINTEDNGIRVDRDTIKLLDSLPDEISEVEGYIKKKDLDDFSGLFKNNYSFHVNSQLKSADSKDIFTDQVFLKKEVASKLNLKRNINLGSDYSKFNHEQIGYFKGDPCLFVWNDNCEYSIFSLTTFVDDLFNVHGLNKPKSYTYPRRDKGGTLISSTEIYKIPRLSETTKTQEIKYFSGRYVIVEADKVTYLFDILNQQGELSGEELYENNDGWVPIETSARSNDIVYYIYESGKWRVLPSIDNIININIYKSFDHVVNLREGYVVGIRGGSKELTSTFIADSMDPFNKLCRLDTLTWQTYTDAIKKYYPFSNVYTNLEWCIASNTIPYRKIGEWIVFKNEENSTITYSNMNKVVKFRSNEEPIVINNQVLLGKSGNSYILYDEPGYFISKSASEIVNQNEKEIFMNEYRVIDGNVKKTYTPTDPISLHRSFLGSFRRNVLPQTLDGFKIIGSLSGIIYYRLGNIINFL